MQEIRSYGSVGVPAGNRRHYPEAVAPRRRIVCLAAVRGPKPSMCLTPRRYV